MSAVDCVYVAACPRDARFTRLCVASIRHFYPDLPIRILPGGRLQRGLREELARYWGVSIANIPAADYGWGFVKLEPLFGPPGERFMVVDSDTVFAGPVLDFTIGSTAPFLVDDEGSNGADRARLYYDAGKVREIDPAVPDPIAAFNSGQWFGTAGTLARSDFEPWVDFTYPRRLRHPDRFMGGDQGVLNCVMLKKEACEGLRVDRRRLMRWPGHSLEGLTSATVKSRTAPPIVIHWAGLKKTSLSRMIGADLLLFFERFYYTRVPAGRLRRALATVYHVWFQWTRYVAVRMTLVYRKWIRGRLQPAS